MAFTSKTWIDRSVEFAMRRLLTAVSGQANTYDIARVSGTVFADGDEPDAATMNDLETRIATGFTDVGVWTDISSLITKNIATITINYALYNSVTKEVRISMANDATAIANVSTLITLPLAYRPTTDVTIFSSGSAKLGVNVGVADCMMASMQVGTGGTVKNYYSTNVSMYYLSTNFSYIVR